MAGLQRSSETFRRSGSSGLVWEDRFLQDGTKQPKKEEDGPGELRHSRSVGSVGMLDRSRSNGGGHGHGHGHRASRVSPAMDPPSPKLSCGCCFGIFSKPAPVNKANRSRGRH